MGVVEAGAIRQVLERRGLVEHAIAELVARLPPGTYSTIMYAFLVLAEVVDR